MENKSKMTFRELAQLYLKDHKLRGKSETNNYQMKVTLENKILPRVPNLPVDDLTYQHMLTMLECYPNLSVSTRNRYFMIARAVFNWGIDHEYISNNPLRKWKQVKERPRQFEITDEDIKKILEHSPPHLKLTIQMTYYLGVRPGPSELFSLKWKDVDFENNEIRVYATKTHQNRRIPIPPQLLAILKKTLQTAKTEYIIEYKGKPVKRVSRSLENAKKKAGVTKDFRLYDLRHMCATFMLNKGADLAAVSHILGHSDTSLTANTYYQPMAAEKTRAAKLIPTLGESEKKRTTKTTVDNTGKKRKLFKISDVGDLGVDE